MLGQPRQSEAMLAGEAVIGTHQHAAVPAVAGQHHQLLEMLDGLGGDGEIGLALGRHLRDLRR